MTRLNNALQISAIVVGLCGAAATALVLLAPGDRDAIATAPSLRLALEDQEVHGYEDTVVNSELLNDHMSGREEDAPLEIPAVSSPPVVEEPHIWTEVEWQEYVKEQPPLSDTDQEFEAKYKDADGTNGLCLGGIEAMCVR